jgi:hypothetical protein
VISRIVRDVLIRKRKFHLPPLNYPLISNVSQNFQSLQCPFFAQKMTLTNHFEKKRKEKNHFPEFCLLFPEILHFFPNLFMRVFLSSFLHKIGTSQTQ